MEVYWCRKRRFCAKDKQLHHCLNQNHHQGCIRLIRLPTINTKKELCRYLNGYIKPEEVDYSDERQSQIWWCERCEYCPQNEDLARCLNQNGKNGCVHLIKLPTEHPTQINNSRTKRHHKKIGYSNRRKQKYKNKDKKWRRRCEKRRYRHL
jgi:hypothetical protein